MNPTPESPRAMNLTANRTALSLGALLYIASLALAVIAYALTLVTIVKL